MRSFENVTVPPQEGFAGRFRAAVAALIERFGAHEIWLFGSCARGNPRADSDVDLVVVRPADSSAPNPNYEARLVVSRIKGRLPMDILVVTPGQWRRQRADPQGVFIDAVERGVLLYAR